MLTPGETIDDYRDATATEVQKYLTPPAVVRPEQALIDEAAAYGVVFNERTNLFEYNTLTDITAAELRVMLARVQTPPYVVPIDFNFNARTNIWNGNTLGETDWSPDMSLMYRSYKLEVVRVSKEALKSSDSYGLYPRQAKQLLYNTTKVHTILGVIDARYITTSPITMFLGATALKNVLLRNLKVSLNLADCPNLSLDSLRFMVAAASNTSAIQITVAPAIYAKMTDDTVPVPGTDSTDWTDYRPNLLLRSGEAVENSAYPMARWMAGSLIPPIGKPVTVTVWGAELGEGKTQFAVLGYDGHKTSANLYQRLIDENGFASAAGVWPNDPANKPSPGIGIWPTPSSVSGVTSRIERIKLTLGDDPNPQWTMCSDEIEDPELRERTQWRELLFMAAARQITFATVES